MSYTQSTYTNTYSNHTDDTLKRFPLNLTWSSATWSNSTTPQTNAKGNIIAEMRQHAKAIEAHFNVTGTDPTYEDADSSLLERGDKINQSIVGGTTGLITGMNKFKVAANVTIPSVNSKLTKSQLVALRNKLTSEAAYSNYSNVHNTGYGKTVINNYGNVQNHTDYSYSKWIANGSYSQRGYYRCAHADGWYTYFNSDYWTSSSYSQTSYMQFCYDRTSYWRYTNSDQSTYTKSGYTQSTYTNYTRSSTPAAVYTNTGLTNPGIYQNTL